MTERKKSVQEIAQDKEQKIMETVAWRAGYYRANPQRFVSDVLFDVKDLEDANDKLGKTLEAFRNGVGTNNLCYGAAYYPYLKTTYLKEIKFTEMSKVSFVKDILNGVEDESDDDEQKKMRLSISTLYRENICNIDYSGVVDDVRNQLISNIKELKDFLQTQ